ncbi:hypothetical protein [Streptomyces tendae]|uniref:hypothetical protein n=1 Tax=Streptomyces tendae TaxID=1932 RepID=UPI003D75313B
MDDQQLAQVGRKAQFAVSTMAMARSAARAYVNAAARYGDAAAAGDRDALERIQEAGRIAGSVTNGAGGCIR